MLADGTHVEVTHAEAMARATDFAGVREIVPPGSRSRAELAAEVERLRAFNDAQSRDWAEAGRNLTAATMERNQLRDELQGRDARIANQRKELRTLRATKDALDKRNDQLLALVGLMARCRNVRASLRCGQRLELEINCNDAFGVGAADAEPFTLDDVPAILAHLDRDPRDGDLRWVMERREARGEPAYPSPALAERLAGKP